MDEIEFLTGPAGTGKTFEILRRMAKDGDWDGSNTILTSTTGISAVNLGGTTINSLLGYYDHPSLVKASREGRLIERLEKLQQFQFTERVVIDEISMLAAESLDIIIQAFDETASTRLALRSERSPIDLVLTGDFFQLPPVNGKWAFEADGWKRVKPTWLTEIKRQSDPNFINAMQAIRYGDGVAGVDLLKSAGVEFSRSKAIDFDGSTLMATNDSVDRYNAHRLSKLPSSLISVESSRWGRQSGEWKQIPERMGLKVGALVMILFNQRRNNGSFEFVNGDLGTLESFDCSLDDDGVVHKSVKVLLQRTGQLVTVPFIRREVTAETHPSGKSRAALVGNGMPVEGAYGSPLWGQEFIRGNTFILGQIEYLPVRLAYAVTIHKSQGLSLDRVQVDSLDGFFSAPNMAYVALSRARSPEGLRIVGTPDTLKRRIQADRKVVEWERRSHV